MNKPLIIPESLCCAFDNKNYESTNNILVTMLYKYKMQQKMLEGFEHPLGFYRILIGVDRELTRYWLHVWRLEDRCTQSSALLIHQHRWNLESLIIHGNLIDRQYRIMQALKASDQTGRIYTTIVLPNTSVLEKTNKLVALKLIDTKSLGKGDFYKVDVDYFHETLVSRSSYCVTLVRASPNLKEQSRVFGPINGPSSFTYIRNRLKNEKIIEILSEFLDK